MKFPVQSKTVPTPVVRASAGTVDDEDARGADPFLLFAPVGTEAACAHLIDVFPVEAEEVRREPTQFLVELTATLRCGERHR
jgi:hypothetical protein